MTAELDLVDSEITDPFLGTKQRIEGKGSASLEFRHDVTDLGLSYGFEYRYPFHGGFRDIDIVTITRNDGARRMNAFIQKIWFDDWAFRLEANNTFDASRCRLRQRFDGTTIDGTARPNPGFLQQSLSAAYSVDTDHLLVAILVQAGCSRLYGADPDCD